MVTPAQRIALEAHIAAERAGDVDGAVAPLAENASYVIPGYVLEGKAAIRALYEFVLPHLPAANFDEYLRALDDPAVTRWGTDHCVIEYTDDYPEHRNMIVVVIFEGDRIRSENTYLRTLSSPPLPMDDVFRGVPGVRPVA
jgi:hypothetical protein